MRVLLFSVLLLSSYSLCGQVQISGKIVDAKDGKILAGASIQEAGEAAGTVSDENGFFSILTSADSLKVAFIGYESIYLSSLLDGAFYNVELLSNNVLGGVTITARPPQVGLRTPEAVAFLSRPDLTRFQELSPATALNQIPGVYMQSGALNTNRITIRGIGNRIPFGTAKIRAYLDEIPLTNGAGETSIEDIDLSFLNNIQVWKGPTASTYGAALGGIIHLQTGASRRPGFRFNNNYEWGDFGLSRQVVQFDYTHPNSNLELNVNYNNTHSDGYRAN
ncbi:MAG: TonB-dependent receptor plug domain-containing protein, partial [Bacteroidota bacterium]